jgi:D-amino-acid oxidase
VIDRRALLRGLAGAAATAALGGSCSSGRREPNVTVAAPPHRRVLAGVQVRPEGVIREVAGLRPFRAPGFRVEAEPLGDKLLIHNYGHGGGGVSLSWGSAHLAVLQALASPHRTAAVLGAGAVGLATARLLQDRGFAVTVYARDLPPDTTSNLAGAQWAPVSLVARDRVTPAFREKYLAASRYAYRYFQTLVGDRYGVRWLENYFLSRTAPQNDEWGYATLFEEILRVETLPPGSHPFPVPFVRRVLSMHIDTGHYLRQVMEDVRLAGGRILVRDFADSVSVSALAEPVVVNCTGLGAAALFGDRELVPVKGQLVVLAPQPEVDYLTIGPGPGVMYMMPRRDGIILGGSFITGDGTTTPDPEQGRRILTSHAELFATSGTAPRPPS